MAPPEPNGRKFVPVFKAVFDVERHNGQIFNHQSVKEAKAIDRLHFAVTKARSKVPHCGAEMIVDLVKDLDVVFYGHVLRGHIEVSWGDPEVFSDVDPKRVGGITLPDTHPYKIYLNSAVFDAVPKRWESFKMASTVILHEMAHALTLVRCEEKVPKSHGPHFRTILQAVHEHSMHRYQIPLIRHQQKIRDHFVSGGRATSHRRHHHHVPEHRPTIDEPHTTSHRRHSHHVPEYNPTTNEVHATSHRRQRRDDHGTNDREHQNTNTGHAHRKHSKTHGHGHKLGTKTKYSQSAMVRQHGDPSCCIIL